MSVLVDVSCLPNKALFLRFALKNAKAARRMFSEDPGKRLVKIYLCIYVKIYIVFTK